MKTTHKSGFTLIELSIVLVIIGLIVGGVLVGQDLIKAAEIRATISQVEKYNTAVRTFQIKYNAMPGDIPAQAANNFGMTGSYLLSGGSGNGDGNGLIESNTSFWPPTAQVSTTNQFLGEVSECFAHLSWAHLIDGSYGTGLITLTGAPSSSVTGSAVNQYVPPAKLGRGMSFTILSGGGLNYYWMAPISAIDTGGNISGGTNGIDPTTAYNIDTKIDDGMPGSGSVLAGGLYNPYPSSPTETFPSSFGLPFPYIISSPHATACTIFSSSPPYNTIYNTANGGGADPTCSLAFKFQ